MIPLVLLAGGKATRLGTIAKDTPKALISVGGKPFIFWQLDQMSKHGISDVIISTGYLGERIKSVAGAGYGNVKLHYSHESEPLGTGGGIKLAVKNFPNLLHGAFFVQYGDSYLEVDYEKIYLKHVAASKPALLAVIENGNQWDKSNAWLEAGNLKYNKEAPPEAANMIDYGLSILEPDILLAYPDAFDMSKLLKEISHVGLLGHHVEQERFYEIGSLSGINEFEQYLGGRQ